MTNYRISDRIGDVTDDTAVLVQPHRTPSEVIAFNRVNRESRVRGGIRVSVRVRVRSPDVGVRSHESCFSDTLQTHI